MMQNETHGHTMNGLHNPWQSGGINHSAPWPEITYGQSECPLGGIVCPETSTMACASGIIEENKRLGDSMSLVGLILCNDKIVGFGDSRSSQTNMIGVMHIDPIRPEINKVFMNDYFIMTACGSNQFWTVDNHRIDLDVWMEQNLAKYDNYLDLLFALQKDSLNGHDMGRVDLLIGTYEKGEMCVISAAIQNHDIIIGPHFYNNSVYQKGVQLSQNQSDKFTQQFYQAIKDGLTEEEFARNLVLDFIQDVDKLGGYNPIGGHIMVKAWEPKR